MGRNCEDTADELVALAMTIKDLNDDDALELFKTTLPSASVSFAQVRVEAQTLHRNALASLHHGIKQKKGSQDRLHHPGTTRKENRI